MLVFAGLVGLFCSRTLYDKEMLKAIRASRPDISARFTAFGQSTKPCLRSYGHMEGTHRLAGVSNAQVVGRELPPASSPRHCDDGNRRGGPIPLDSHPLAPRGLEDLSMDAPSGARMVAPPDPHVGQAAACADPGRPPTVLASHAPAGPGAADPPEPAAVFAAEATHHVSHQGGANARLRVAFEMSPPPSPPALSVPAPPCTVGTDESPAARPWPPPVPPRASSAGTRTERMPSDGPQEEKQARWRYFNPPKFVLSKFCRGTMAIVFGLAVWVCRALRSCRRALVMPQAPCDTSRL